MTLMKHFYAPIFALALSTSPVLAEENSSVDEGLGLMEKGVQLFMQGIFNELEPTMNEFQQMVEEAGPQLRALLLEMGPALVDALNKVDDFSYYEKPEVLPNGDIVIRREKDAPKYVPPSPEAEEPQGEIEL